MDKPFPPSGSEPMPRRNDHCPCGSGRKFKQCCAVAAAPAPVNPKPARSVHLERISRLSAAGRYQYAIELARKALKADPNDAAILGELGLAQIRAGRQTEAIESLLAAVARAPMTARHHYYLGLAYQQASLEKNAMSAYQQAAALDPNMTDAHEKIGGLLLSQGQRDAAILAFRRVANLATDPAAAGLARARILIETGQPAEAEATLREVLVTDPRQYEASSLLGGMLREQGRFEEAIKTLDHAIDVQPAYAPAYLELVQSKRVTGADRPLIARMQKGAALRGLPDAYRATLNFALGKAFDDLGDYAGAIRAYDAGNRLARQRIGFDRAQFGAGVNRLIAGFSADFLAAHRGLGSADETPLLILGMPRSGTTLVEQVISNHPAVAGAGELEFWNDRAAAYAQAGSASLEPAYFDALANDYLSLLRGIGPEAARVTDKNPGNFLWIGLIRLAFPNARIIHCRRDPIDTCLSNYFTHFNARLGFACDRVDLVFYHRYYARLMAHWRAVLPPDRFLDLDYEDLIGDRETVTRRMIAFCGLEWDEACLNPESNRRVVKTASMWQARQRPYQTSVKRHRHYLPWLGELSQLVDPDGDLPKSERPIEAETLIGQAARQRSMGRIDEAIASLNKAARLSPNDPWIDNEVGLIYLHRYAWAQAVDSFERAVALDRGFAFAYYNLGFALERLRRQSEAIAAYRQAVALAPSLSEAFSRMGNLLHARGNRQEALDCFRSAADASPNTTLGRLNRVKLCLEGDEPVEAEALLRQIVAEDPGASEAWRLLGNLQREAGRFDEAVRSLEVAISRDSLQVAAYHDLAHARRFSDAERPLIERMLTRSRGQDLTDFERSLLNFALGKGYDDLGEYERAMGHFDQGNRLEHALTAFDRVSFAGWIDRLIECTSRARLSGLTGFGAQSALPVVIVGMPRSGTTLVEQIVSSHPAVGAGGELRFWNERMPAAIETINPTAINELANEYLDVLGRIAPSAERVTDKMPFNFLWSALIHAALPEARIVHCRRDPIDTCLSIYFTRFATRQEFAYDLGDIAFYFRQYERLMAHYRAVLPPNRFLDLDYEDLVRDREATTRTLIDFIGVDWDDACLRPENNGRVIKTASMWQARQPVYVNSVERWRRYEPWLGELSELKRGAM